MGVAVLVANDSRVMGKYVNKKDDKGRTRVRRFLPMTEIEKGGNAREWAGLAEFPWNGQY
jgi:hypothetical protein